MQTLKFLPLPFGNPIARSANSTKMPPCPGTGRITFGFPFFKCDAPREPQIVFENLHLAPREYSVIDIQIRFVFMLNDRYRNWRVRRVSICLLPRLKFRVISVAATVAATVAAMTKGRLLNAMENLSA
ncbi:MAG: hypothetical protein ACR2FI_08150 [Burkholderiales bacterium]